MVGFENDLYSFEFFMSMSRILFYFVFSHFQPLILLLSSHSPTIFGVLVWILLFFVCIFSFQLCLLSLFGALYLQLSIIQINPSTIPTIRVGFIFSQFHFHPKFQVLRRFLQDPLYLPHFHQFSLTFERILPEPNCFSMIFCLY